MRDDQQNLIAAASAVQSEEEIRENPRNPAAEPVVSLLSAVPELQPLEESNGSPNNNLRITLGPSLHPQTRPWGFSFGGAGNWSKRAGQIWRFHWRLIASALLTVFSAMGAIIAFPIYLRTMTTPAPEVDEPFGGTEPWRGDGYSACLSIVTTSTALMWMLGLGLKAFHSRSTVSHGRAARVLRPILPLPATLKIGFCTGLCLLTLCYAWEDHKVLCNLQDPLLALVFLFAVLTHAVNHWRQLGFRRSFALVTVGAGIFISVDYTVVDHYKCRGHYYYEREHGGNQDPWSWQVHLVWTLAYVVSLWLWTVAMFCMEASVLPKSQAKEKRHHVGELYNAVKLKVIRVKRGPEPEPPLAQPEDLDQHPDACGYSSIRQLQLYSRSIYSRITYLRVYNAVLWFHVATWGIVASLFWTQLVPGFGAGRLTLMQLPAALAWAHVASWTSLSSWLLTASSLIFAQSFAYLTLLIRSPLIAIGVACLAFPLVSVWWSCFVYNHNALIWAPMVSGELVCGCLGIPLILAGIWYLFKLDVLKLDFKEGRAPGGGVLGRQREIV